MKRLVAAFVALCVGVTVLVVVILDGGDEELDKCSANGVSRGPVSGGVPDGEFSLPSPGWPDHFTSGYGPRWGTMHEGVDIANGVGTPIYAFADGVVRHAGPAQGFGNWIVIDHDGYGEFFSTVYGHMYDNCLLYTSPSPRD